MKIVCPIPADYNIKLLINSGISEFYFGYIPVFWKKEYSLLSSINRRYSSQEQLGSKSKIMRLIEGQAKKNIRFYLALNAPLYTSEQISGITQEVGRFKEKGLAGVIVSDAGLIMNIRRNFPTLEIHASCGAVCLNSQSVKWFHEIGAKRVILERSLGIGEIQTLVKENPKVEFEAFACVAPPDDCLYIDGLCTHHHCDRKRTPCFRERNYLRKLPKAESEEGKYLRIYRLFNAGVRYIKFPERGAKAHEIISKYSIMISFIRYLSAVKPKSLNEFKRKITPILNKWKTLY
jgi:hypothetical protein